MTWWRTSKPAPATSESRDLLAESEAQRESQEEHERMIIAHFRELYRKRNADMDALPEFGTTGNCPACGVNEHIRTFKKFDLEYACRAEPYNLMDVECGSCGYPLGQEKAQNFALPRWFRARRGREFETILIDDDTDN